MELKDPIEENAKLVLDAYDYALTHNLNIKSKQDVANILKAIDPEHANDEFVESLMTMLQVTDTLIKTDLAKRKKKIVN